MSVPNSSARPGTRPTARELEVLRTWDRLKGDTDLTARELGMTRHGVKALLANVRARAGVRRTWLAVREYLD